jgi:hypothetical protein
VLGLKLRSLPMDHCGARMSVGLGPVGRRALRIRRVARLEVCLALL